MSKRKVITLSPDFDSFMDRLRKTAPDLATQLVGILAEVVRPAEGKTRTTALWSLVVGLCGAGFVLIGLFPPWVLHLQGLPLSMGYAFITIPPTVANVRACRQVDLSRLVVEWITWGFVCGVVSLIRKKT